MLDPISFYSTHSEMTYLPDEPKINELLKESTDSIPSIIETVQNTLIHIFWAEKYGEKLSEERAGEVNIRSAAAMLRKAYMYKPEKLSVKRDPSEKVVGNCRDFSVLSLALLRNAGIPARARCGFGAYFSSPEMKLQYIDHWVVEYWSTVDERWIMVDSQIDKLQAKELRINFDPLNVPSNMFITGGAAWKMCREGKADPENFGIHNMSGLGFIMGDLIRDLAALGKMPLLPWDCWGLMLEDWSKEMKLLDSVAEVTQPATMRYDEINRLNKDPRLMVPEVITSWMGGTQPIKIKLTDVTEKI